MNVDDNASMDSGDADFSNNNKNNVSEDDDTIVEIAADGDLIMVVGPKKKKFRLHSLILKMTSKVFRAMLGLNFAEGQQLIANETTGSREPGKINLPEDDVESMDFIFKTLHHQFDALENPEDLPFFEILVAADKYDLLSAIKHAFRHALAAVVEEGETLAQMCSEGLWKLAMAAAFVENSPAFKAATRALILHCNERYLDYAEQWFLNETFAFHACAAIEEARASSKDRMMADLLNACHMPFSSIMDRMGLSGSEVFIHLSLSAQIDCLESLDYDLAHQIQVDDCGNYWTDELNEKSGFDLVLFS
ncbi:unnamed protein product [Colletotrichum noveboracense]|uniref:BTB domain-containing protein n=1 Tax=Colletotrichum noveboracense TaxID=2664923 RepID=A0A9W4S3C2_9PEZI|nr:unnamed protein product [Colletotrichum noveboracense]